VTAAFRLDGSMIPRSVKRMFDERAEPREEAGASATFEWRGRSIAVELTNVSTSGAMVICDKIPHIGETVALHLPDHEPAAGVVTWVRDGRIGIHFAAPLK
jgi:PilZ domain